MPSQVLAGCLKGESAGMSLNTESNRQAKNDNRWTRRVASGTRECHHRDCWCPALSSTGSEGFQKAGQKSLRRTIAQRTHQRTDNVGPDTSTVHPNAVICWTLRRSHRETFQRRGTMAPSSGQNSATAGDRARGSGRVENCGGEARRNGNGRQPLTVAVAVVLVLELGGVECVAYDSSWWRKALSP